MIKRITGFSLKHWGTHLRGGGGGGGEEGCVRGGGGVRGLLVAMKHGHQSSKCWYTSDIGQSKILKPASLRQYVSHNMLWFNIPAEGPTVLPLFCEEETLESEFVGADACNHGRLNFFGVLF